MNGNSVDLIRRHVLWRLIRSTLFAQVRLFEYFVHIQQAHHFTYMYMYVVSLYLSLHDSFITVTEYDIQVFVSLFVCLLVCLFVFSVMIYLLSLGASVRADTPPAARVKPDFLWKLKYTSGNNNKKKPQVFFWSKINEIHKWFRSNVLTYVCFE